MEDEYGAMDDGGLTYNYDGVYNLDLGGSLKNPRLRYQTYGKLNEAKDNVLVVCHALTGNASLHSWWPSILGPNLAFDTSKYLIVCANILGSNYGSTSPLDQEEDGGEAYGMSFPDVSVRDTSRLILHLLASMGITSVKSVIGGSFGGMQALEMALISHASDHLPEVRSCCPIASNVAHGAWQIGISHVQREAIAMDPQWQKGEYSQAKVGLSLARQIGMISYRTRAGYEEKFSRDLVEVEDESPLKNFQVKSYLNYQGQKFLTRFDPLVYYKLTEQMDTHDVYRNRSSDVLSELGESIPSLTIGISSDVLYPIEEQVELFQKLSNAGEHDINKCSENAPVQVGNTHFLQVPSNAGHDGFLLEQAQVNHALTNFLENIN